MTFILIRFSSMGDVILQTSVVAWIRMNFPDAKIIFITAWEFRSLVENHPFIDDVFAIKRLKGKKDREQLAELAAKIDKLNGPKLIIDLHNTLRAKYIRFKVKDTFSLAVPKRTLLRKIFTKFKLNFLKGLASHHERVLIDLSRFLGKDFLRKDLEDFILEKSQNKGKTLTSLPVSFQEQNTELPFDLPEKYLVIAPIASFPNKRWPLNYFKEVCLSFLNNPRYKSFKIVLVAGPDDHYCEQVVKGELENNARFLNLQGKTTIAQSTAVIRKAELVVSNDTATVHMAEAFGGRVLALFGPTHEDFGFRPHLEKSKALSSEVSCRPCSATGKKACTQASLVCMEKILPQTVLDEIDTMLAVE